MADSRLFDNLMVDLTTLGQIKENQCIYTNGKNIEIRDYTSFQWFVRRMCRESHEKNIKFIQDHLKQVSQTVDNHCDDLKKQLEEDTRIKVKNHLVRLRNGLLAAKTGVKNLISVMENKATSKSELTNFIYTMDEVAEKAGRHLARKPEQTVSTTAEAFSDSSSDTE